MPLSRLPVAYLALAIASVPLSLWPGGSFEALRWLLIGVALFFVVATAPARPSTVVMLERTFTYGATLFAIALLVTGVYIKGNRLTLPYGSYDSNDSAMLMAVGCSLVLADLFRKGVLVRAIALVSAAVLIVAVLKTGSRGGLLALGAGLLVTAGRLSGSKKFALAFMLAIGIPVAWSTAPPEIKERFSTIFTPSEDYNTFAYGGRKMIWKRGIGYMLQNPALGVGIASFNIAEGKTMSDNGMTGLWMSPHNSFVQAGAELGVGGLALLCGMLVLGGRVAFSWRSPAHQPVSQHFVAAIVAFAVGAFFLSHAYSYIMFGLLGLIVLVHRTHRVTPGQLVP